MKNDDNPNSPPVSVSSDIVAYNVERVLADIDANHGSRSFECLGHGVHLVFGAPCQLLSLAGQEHGRTIPLSGKGLVSPLLATS
jgi:hypothetical protein